MHSLLARVLRTIRRHDLIPPDGRVIVAVSGGSDSVALVYLLAELAGLKTRPTTENATSQRTRPTTDSTMGLRTGPTTQAEGDAADSAGVGRVLRPAAPFAVVGLVHLNHRIRGEAADRDEQFCRRLASELSLPIEVESVDVPALARERRTSLEDAARQVRYAFFERAAARLGADRVAVGHTRDDQAETFLLRLVRGAGPRGLAGIYPRSGLVIRPLLEVTRTALRAYLAEREAVWCEDETNRDLSIPRNRVRHELVPYLEANFSPGIIDVLAREADIAREDAAWLDEVAGVVAERVVQLLTDRVEIDVAALAGEPPALARRVLHHALAAAGGRFVGFDHVDRLRAALGSEAAGAMDLPGQRAVWTEGRLTLTRRRGRRAADSTTRSPFRYELSIPGEARVPEAGLAITAQAAASSASGDRLAGRGDTAVVAARGLTAPLVVRNRRPGDAFRPLGLGGRKKLQDFFVDRKIARAERDTIPLVVDAGDRIIWVVGQALADDFRVTEPAEGVIILKARRLDKGSQG